MKSPLLIGSLNVQLQNVTLPFGLTVDQIDVSGQNLSINTSSGKIEGVEGDTAVAIVGEQNLLEFLQKELPEQLKELEVFIGDGFIKLNAKATIIFQVNVSAITKLVLANEGSEVLIELTDVSPGGPVRSVVEGQLEKMNPIIKASDLPIALEFTSVSLQEGQIRLSAKLKPSPPIEIPEP